MEASKEVEKLRARIAELEQALTQQVSAARQAGMKEGEAAGLRQGEAAVKPVLDRMARAVQDLIALKPRLQKEFETDAVQLSLAIARRVLRREMNVDPSALCGLVQAAFERLGRSEIVRVIVHPEQAGPIREQLGQMTTRKVEVVADGSREKGTLVFETTRGALDGSVDSQLKEIELGFADRLKWK
jgi:flagellar assembly protein FliH